MTIKNKLRVTFGCFFGLLIVVVAATSVVLNAQKADGIQINLAGRQRMLSQRMTKEFLQFTSAESEDKAEEFRARLAGTIGLFDTTVYALRGGGETTGTDGNPVALPPAQDEAVIAALDEGIELWSPVRQAVMGVVEPGVGRDSEAVRHAGEVLASKNVPLLKVMNKATGAFQASSDHRRETLTTIQYGAVVFGFVVALGAGYFVHRAVLRPIMKVIARIDDLARGDGDLTVRLPENGRDEISDLSAKINVFIGQMHDLVAQVRTSALEVAGGAEELHGVFDEIAVQADSQQAHVERIAAAMEQSAASSSHVSSQIESMTRHAGHSGEQATKGAEMFGETVNDLGSIRSSVQQVVESIGQLGDRGEQIGSVINVINDIADQTNLLALNAAIEAARAGEHGRGFAVVADEVRKLADRTTTATEEISGQIKSIQTDTRNAEERMDDGQRQVSAGVERASAGASDLDSLRSDSLELTQMVEQVAAAAEEQSLASHSVSESITEINRSIGSLSQGTSEARGSIAMLNEKGERLRSLVERFRL